MIPTVCAYSTGTLSPTSGRLAVDVINVGQGNCVLVSMPDGSHMLVDGGSTTAQESSTACQHIKSYLTSVVGTKDIERIVITHGDKDHISLIQYLAQAKKPQYITYGGSREDVEYTTYLKDWFEAQDVRSQKNEASIVTYDDGYFNTLPVTFLGTIAHVNMYVLSANYGGDKNSQSIVLMLTYGGQAFILTGDAGWDTEWFILENFPESFLSSCTAMMPGHHGSYYSTTQTWADTLKAASVVISASPAGGYGHPNTDTVVMLEKHAASGVLSHRMTAASSRSSPYVSEDITKGVYLTATNGDVRWITDGANVQVFIEAAKVAYTETALFRETLLAARARNLSSQL